MKYVLLLGLFFCVYQQAAGVTPCFTGVKMGGQPAGSVAESNCPVTHSCSLVSGLVSASGIQMDIEMGQCVLEAACSFMKCSTIKSNLPPSMPGTFGNCEAKCCKDGVCVPVLENGGPPIVPYGPIVPVDPEYSVPVPENPDPGFSVPVPDSVDPGFSVPVPENPVDPGYSVPLPGNPVPEHMPLIPSVSGSRCQVPMWGSMQLQDNWNGISGRSSTPTPKFKVVMKKLDKQGGYRPGKTYKYVVMSVKNKKATPKLLMMNAYYVTLQSNSSDCACKEEGAAMCPVGNFVTSRVRKMGVPVVQPGCDEPAVMELRPGDGLKKSNGKWRAPSCTDAEIIMRVYVRTSDNRLYQDNEEVSEHFLTKVIRPAPKKAKKPKKPKKPKRPKKSRRE